MGGWIAIAGWRRSGCRPLPSSAGGSTARTGLARNTIRPRKKPAHTSSDAVAHGASVGARRRADAIARLDHPDSSHTHSSSEPSCEDHSAVSLYNVGVVVLECDATTWNEKSDRAKASSTTTITEDRTANSANRDRRPATTQSGRARRAPYTLAAMPNAVRPSARNRHARAKTSI